MDLGGNNSLIYSKSFGVIGVKLKKSLVSSESSNIGVIVSESWRVFLNLYNCEIFSCLGFE